MSDTALYVSLAANATLTLSHLAKGWRKQQDTHAEMVLQLLERVGGLEKSLERANGRIDTLEVENAALERARFELQASEKRSKALIRELKRMYREVTGSHSAISVAPPQLEDDDETEA